MKTYLFCLFVLGYFTLGYAQAVELPETVISINGNYINYNDTSNTCKYIEKLKNALLDYDHNEISDLYDSKQDVYKVTFKIPEGKIIASFNKDGKIVETFEKYINVKLPYAVLKAIAEKYPNYSIEEDIYIVKFHNDGDARQQEYRVKIKKETSVLNLTTNSQGDFI